MGSSQDLRKRIKDYFDNTNLNNSKGSIICKALIKHGHDSFNLKILEYCSLENLLVREQYYIDTLKPEYNILSLAGNSRGYIHTEASKELMSLGRKGWEYTPDELANFSSESVRNKSTVLTNSVTGETLTYPSMKSAAEFLDTTATTLRNYLSKNLPYNDYIISVNVDNELSSKPQSLLLTNMQDSSTKEFSTIKDAAVFLEVSRSSLSYALNKPNNGEQNGCKIGDYLVTRIESDVNYIRPGSVSIEVTDLENNTTNVYPSITLAGQAIGVSKASISQYIRGKQATLYKGRYILKQIS